MNELTPTPALQKVSAYSVPRPDIPVDLYLHGNEGPAPPASTLRAVDVRGADLLRDYPKADALEAVFAARAGVDRDEVLVTAGADDALDRVCRAMLGPGRNIVLPEPTFGMLRRLAIRAGGAVKSVGWPGSTYPTDAVIDAVDDHSALIAMVSPNNPTGACATADDLRRVAEAAPHALVVVDHAYVEFGDHDLTAIAQTHANTVVTRTMSKAWGMAGVRVGYALASPTVIAWLRAVGLPYAVSGPSLAFATRRLEEGDPAIAEFVHRVKDERSQLQQVLADVGVDVQPSQANFVFGRYQDALWVRDGLASQGILVRAFPDDDLLADALRMTCPGDAANFARLQRAIRTVFEPEALIFDLDGVLADVSESYFRSIQKTAETYGQTVSAQTISEAKAAGEANNDWALTQTLLARRGVEADLAEVTERFEAIYQGTDDTPGLREAETLLVDPAYLANLADQYSLAVVTGRPRKDAQRFLDDHGIGRYFGALVCMEDGPLKPDPAPVASAVDQLGCQRAWMIGDTPDDAAAGRAAGLLSVGVVAPGHDAGVMRPALTRAGCARVVSGVDQLHEYLP